MENNPYELYSNYERLDEATEHIRTMIALSVDKVRATAAFLRCRPTHEMAERAWSEMVKPVLLRHREGGACDSEPYGHTQFELSDRLGLDWHGRWC